MAQKGLPANREPLLFSYELECTKRETSPPDTSEYQNRIHSQNRPVPRTTIAISPGQDTNTGMDRK